MFSISNPPPDRGSDQRRERGLVDVYVFVFALKGLVGCLRLCWLSGALAVGLELY